MFMSHYATEVCKCPDKEHLHPKQETLLSQGGLSKRLDITF